MTTSMESREVFVKIIRAIQVNWAGNVPTVVAGIEPRTSQNLGLLFAAALRDKVYNGE